MSILWTGSSSTHGLPEDMRTSGLGDGERHLDQRFPLEQEIEDLQVGSVELQKALVEVGAREERLAEDVSYLRSRPTGEGSSSRVMLVDVAEEKTRLAAEQRITILQTPMDHCRVYMLVAELEASSAIKSYPLASPTVCGFLQLTAPMFSLRINTVETSPPNDGPSSGATTYHPSPAAEASGSGDPLAQASSSSATTSRNPNPRIQAIRGVIHLYRTTSPAATSSSTVPQPSPDALLPTGRGTILFVLAVPSRLSREDFLHFCSCVADIDSASSIRFIKNDGIEDRYSVLVKFDEQKSADGFYLNLNGWRFYTAEGEVCHILFLDSVEYTDSMELAGAPPSGSTELPTCPVCLERLDQDISGIVATTCDHSYQCSCISKWNNSSCTVCQFCREHSEKPTCSICGTSENLWICVICGFVGCGRYKEGHAFRHWKETQHCYSLDLETQRVWDYVGDNYVHRLNQSKSDDKLVQMKSNYRWVGGKCKNCNCNDDIGVSGVIFNSKLEATVDEYSRLLASELDNRRQYFETLILEAKENREKNISEAVEKAVSLKVQDIQLQIGSITKENKIVAEINDNLMKSQNHWREKVKEIEARERETLKLQDEKIRDLEEEIRDFTVCIEAQKTLGNMGADDIRGGTLLPVSSPPPPAKSKRSSRINRRRN